MPRKYRRPTLVLGLVAVVAALVAIFAGVSHGPSHVAIDKSKLMVDPDRAGALASRHARTTVGLKSAKNHEGIRTPASLQLQELQDRAYPANTVLNAWQNAARSDFASDKARGADGSGSWQLAGPATSTVPSLLNRTNSDETVSGRVTAMAIDSTCTASLCRVWVGAAGGGIWRSDNGLAADPHWTYVSGNLPTNAVGTLTYDAASHTLYAGTGEPNSSADSDAGLGIFASTDYGDHWTLLPGSPAMSAGNSIGSIVLDPAHPGTMWVGTTYGVRGMAGVGGGAQPSYIAPDAPKPGLWKSTDGGQSFSLVYDDSNGAWGVNHVALDKFGTVYFSAEGEGIYRLTSAAKPELIFATQDPGGRTEFAVNTDTDGHTLIYAADGGTELTNPDGSPILTPDQASFASDSGVYLVKDVDQASAASLTDGTSNPGWTSLTTYDRTQPGYLTWDYCWAQCWYDNFVFSPAGHPDVVYVLGAYDYNFAGARDNGKTVILGTNYGANWYDQTADNGDMFANGVNGIHPDQHAIIVNPSNPYQFFEGSDGGVVRSSGQLKDGSSDCANRGLSAKSTIACQNALKQIPTKIDAINTGLSTLQFQGVAVNPWNAQDVIGGTQDNGTWEGASTNQNWTQAMWGDGGIAAFDIKNQNFRMNEFYGPYTDVNMTASDPTAWVTVAGPLAYSGEATAFYKPQINDPVTSGTFFIGGQHVWRTQDFGGVTSGGFSSHCTEFQPGLPQDCGDFAPLGDPNPAGGSNQAGDLTAKGVYGTDKSGGYVVALARASSDTTTLWTATRRGRVFISKNANAAAPLVSFTRIDAGSGLAAGSSATPRRFVSGIVVDPKNANHAWVSFGGYNNATDGVTPPVAGHVFDVTYDPLTGKATWTSLDRGNGPLGDMPINAMALDAQTNRLYVATDFGVLVSVGKSGFWRPAADGMPNVAVSGLTLDSQHRLLYAATHGRGVWVLGLNGGGKS